MSAPIAEFEANGSPDAGALLDALDSLAAPERRKHATVFNYWLSIRGERKFPLIRDLDPLQISDAGPQSVLLGIIDGGEDANIRHIGAAIKDGIDSEKISEIPTASILSCIAAKLPAVVASEQPFAFEGAFEGPEGLTRCWVSLLPFSASGSSVDYVYGFVTLAAAGEAVEAEMESVDVEAAEADGEVAADANDEEVLVLEDAVEASDAEDEAVTADEASSADETMSAPGLSGDSENLNAAPGFYGRVADLQLGQWKVESPDSDEFPHGPAEEPEDALQEVPSTVEEPEETMQQLEQEIQTADAADAPAGGLQAMLADVRAKADEARVAKLRSNTALYEGLSAAYDFALDAEHEPEDYLKLVEAEGLKIQLRAPMAPVVKLAFKGLCDDSTIAQLEAVLGWALAHDLPRGSLAERIHGEGGIGAILDGLGNKA